MTVFTQASHQWVWRNIGACEHSTRARGRVNCANQHDSAQPSCQMKQRTPRAGCTHGARQALPWLPNTLALPVHRLHHANGPCERHGGEGDQRTRGMEWVQGSPWDEEGDPTQDGKETCPNRKSRYHTILWAPTSGGDLAGSTGARRIVGPPTESHGLAYCAARRPGRQQSELYGEDAVWRPPQ